MTTKAGALDHLKVLDLSRVLAGPYCAQMLADLGADVIKVERPGDGDDTRKWGPPFMPDADGNPTPHATYIHCTNRNKRAPSRWTWPSPRARPSSSRLQH